MNIPPTRFEQDGPGINRTNQPDRVAVRVADPVSDLAYAGNAVTLS